MDICNDAIGNNDETDGNSSTSDLESLTQIIPEYLVSVKLETSENSNVSEAGSVCSPLNRPDNVLAAARMQNNPSNVGHRPPPPGFNKPSMPEFSAWVHSASPPSAAENQHSAYLAHESATSKMATNPNLKVANGGIGGLVNGDVCDSSTFLNYVLNQQRSNGIFMFDHRPSGMEPPPSATGQNYAAANTSCQNCKTTAPRNAEGALACVTSATYRDASTNTPVKYCGAERDYEPKVECVKCCSKTKTSETPPTTKSFYSQLGLQPHKGGGGKLYDAPCKRCGRPNPDPNASSCGGCRDAQATPKAASPCKCVRDCSSDCVRNNRRLHFLDVDRPYTCEICLKNYPSEGALVNHLRYHKGDRPYQCETCNKAFATNSHLTTHKRTHSGERPFECPECFKTFSDRSSYVKHSRTHGPDGATVKKFKCPVCGNTFVDSCGLKKHIRIHTGERPYVCAVCDKAFATSSTFVAHKRIHSGERPYSCATCDKRFVTKSHLLTHGRVHSGEKPFCCQVCNRAFADGSSYRRHERLHTGENRFTCDVCGKGFPYETSLAKHKQSHVPGTSSYVYMTA